MSKRQLIILCAALIILFTLILRLPGPWLDIINIVLALLIIGIAFTTTKPSQNKTHKPHAAPYIDTPVSTPSQPAPEVTNSNPQA